MSWLKAVAVMTSAPKIYIKHIFVFEATKSEPVALYLREDYEYVCIHTH